MFLSFKNDLEVTFNQVVEKYTTNYTREILRENKVGGIMCKKINSLEEKEVWVGFTEEAQ